MQLKRVLNITEASKLLGFKVSYVYKLTSAKIIPHSKPNFKTIYFDREKLIEWMLSNPCTTLSDKKNIATSYVVSSSNKKQNNKNRKP